MVPSRTLEGKANDVGSALEVSGDLVRGSELGHHGVQSGFRREDDAAGGLPQWQLPARPGKARFKVKSSGPMQG